VRPESIAVDANQQPDDAGRTGQDWSEAEVEQIVADYFEMLRKELHCQPYSKAEHRRSLMPSLGGRSEGSVEFKHCNVSGVLVGMGLPYVEGYKPRGNYQMLLADTVAAFLDARPHLLEQMRQAPLLCPASLPDLQLFAPAEVVEEPPERIILPDPPGKPWLTLRGRRIDFAKRDAANRLLGVMGEEFALWYERRRLIAAGRDDLAAKVRWVARDLGDGLGFDILSFDPVDGSELYVEVKATGLGKYFPFLVTDLELRCSEDVGDRFCLYRVFDAGRRPRLYVLPRSLRHTCELVPTLYQATLRTG
jgi:hypothetical protein